MNPTPANRRAKLPFSAIQSNSSTLMELFLSASRHFWVSPATGNARQAAKRRGVSRSPVVGFASIVLIMQPFGGWLDASSKGGQRLGERGGSASPIGQSRQLQCRLTNR